jgi:hypothetical protein
LAPIEIRAEPRRGNESGVAGALSSCALRLESSGRSRTIGSPGLARAHRQGWRARLGLMCPRSPPSARVRALPRRYPTLPRGPPEYRSRRSAACRSLFAESLVSPHGSALSQPSLPLSL